MFLTLAEVESLVRLKKSAIYRKMKAGTFPKQRKIAGTSKSGWLSTEIHHLILTSPIAK